MPGGTLVAGPRVVVAHRDVERRTQLAAALRAHGSAVLAHVPDGRQLLELVRHYRPEVVLLDLRLPTAGGLATCLALHDVAPMTRGLLLLDGVLERSLLREAVEAGAAGVLAGGADVPAVARAVAGAARGEVAFPRAATSDLVDMFRAARADAHGRRPLRSPLTTTEWAIADVLMRTSTLDEAGRTLAMAPAALRRRLRDMGRKLSACDGLDDVRRVVARAASGA